MKRIIPLAAVVVFVAVSTLAAVAASNTTPKPQVHVAWTEHLTVVDKMAGQVRAVVGLKVNGRRVPVRVVKVTFVPQDATLNTCGIPLVGHASGATANLVAPHLGANMLVVTTTARSTRKVAGRYRQTILVRSAYLGGIFYECAHGSPPTAQAVCDYGTPQPGTINTSATDCGIPLKDQPFWTGKPTLVGNTVLVPHIGIYDGYCWATKPGLVNWFGGKMSYAEAWTCSNGVQLLPDLQIWLTAPNDLNGYPECRTRNDWGAPWANFGSPWSFQAPAGLGGRLDVQWSFAVLPPDPLGNKPPIGVEWSSASFFFHGSLDGCQQLLAPAVPVG